LRRVGGGYPFDWKWLDGRRKAQTTESWGLKTAFSLSSAGAPGACQLIKKMKRRKMPVADERDMKVKPRRL
jgi:hypothetical protein